MKRVLMAKGAKTIVNTCVKVKSGENVLIITEVAMMSIAESIAAEVFSIGAVPIISVVVPRESDGQEPPLPISEAMKNSDAFMCVVNKSITHTHAVKDAIKNGSRGVMLTQFSEDMMVQGGLEANFEEIAPVCKSMAGVLAGAKEIRLTTPYGTDLTFSAEGRRGNSLYCMVEKGEFSTIPTIEANVSPLEGTAKGKIVADASIPYIGIGLLEEPVVLEVENGKVISIDGGRQAKMLEKDLKSKNDPNVYNIAELGVGLNPKCRFIGFMLEDEGVYGAVHIGIGTNITLGGVVKAACHYDVIMTKPTINVDGRIVLRDGDVCL